MKLIWTLLLFIPFYGSAQIDGDWYTSFVIAGTSVNLKMNIDIEASSEIKLSDLDGQFEDVVIEEHEINNDSISFSWAAIGLSFNGKYDKDQNNIDGMMSQSGLEWDVNFTKEIQEEIEIVRPQEPQPPFDYTVEDLIIKNGDIQLGATLTLPKNFSETTPVVILASGSGAQDRNCEIMGHKPFWVIADHLAKNEIACLRFDDRGVGESTGVFAEADLSDFASDNEACLKFLRKKKKYKKNKIGIAGHSEGGVHALITATECKKLDFIIELASIGGSAGDVLIEQQYLIPIQAGFSEESAVWNKTTYEGIVEILMTVEEPTDALTKFLGDHYDAAPEEYTKGLTRAGFIMGQLMMFNTPWGVDFVKYDAQGYLSEIDIPLLAINGEKDIQVPAASNSLAFEKYSHATTHIVPELNHLMQSCNTCTVTEYGDLEESFSVGVMDLMVKWIKEL